MELRDEIASQTTHQGLTFCVFFCNNSKTCQDNFLDSLNPHGVHNLGFPSNSHDRSFLLNHLFLLHFSLQTPAFLIFHIHSPLQPNGRFLGFQNELHDQKVLHCSRIPSHHVSASPRLLHLALRILLRLLCGLLLLQH